MKPSRALSLLRQAIRPCLWRDLRDLRDLRPGLLLRSGIVFLFLSLLFLFLVSLSASQEGRAQPKGGALPLLSGSPIPPSTGPSPPPEAQPPVVPPATVQVTEEHGAILRSGPSTDHDRLTLLPKGIRVSLEEVREEWGKVRLSHNYSGWILSKSYTKAPNAQIPSSPDLLNIKIKARQEGTMVEIKCAEPGAFVVTQWLSPPTLLLDFHHAASKLYEIDFSPGDTVISHCQVTQREEDIVSIKFDLKHPPSSGYELEWKENTLLLFFRKSLKERGIRGFKNLRVILDPGHGGSDTGAVGVHGTIEKDLNLSIALQLMQMLRSRGARVFLTRSSDRDVTSKKATTEEELRERVKIARARKGDLYLSIHFNAKPKVEEARRARGTYVYYYEPQSFLLASILAKHLALAVGEPTYGVNFRSFHVIRQTAMPAVLLEVAFLSNPAEEKKLAQPIFQKRAVLGILNGLQRFLSAAP